MQAQLSFTLELIDERAVDEQFAPRADVDRLQSCGTERREDGSREDEQT